MSGELLALFLAVGVPLSIRLIDYFFPKGKYFNFVDRYSKDNDEDDDGDPIEVG